jgi:hypothetical protein
MILVKFRLIKIKLELWVLGHPGLTSCTQWPQWPVLARPGTGEGQNRKNHSAITMLSLLLLFE